MDLNSFSHEFRGCTAITMRFALTLGSKVLKPSHVLPCIYVYSNVGDIKPKQFIVRANACRSQKVEVTFHAASKEHSSKLSES